MGKQINFYMTPQDFEEFSAWMQMSAPIMISLRDSEVPGISPVDRTEIGSGKTLIFWNPTFCPRLERKWIPDPGYFRVDTLREPVLECMPSFAGLWKGEAAIGQGRIFGNFESYLQKPKDFEKWYESLARWIRKNYRKNLSSVGGYIGPEAQMLVAAGKYLLPSFLPPETPEWETELRARKS